MKADFHYYCIAVICRCAGFSKKDSLKIAYSSQYVDHSTESPPIRIDDAIFDPVRTAHYGLRSLGWEVQKEVYIAFHFLPPDRIKNISGDFITQPDSKFANDVLNDALSEKDEKLRPYRIGIALHTFADTWSHQGFSGRRNNENDVEEIQIFEGNKWKELFFENLFFDVSPKIGHSEAGIYPDKAYLKWRCLINGKETIRNNTQIFIKAAKRIHQLLSESDKPYPPDIQIPFDELEGAFSELFSYQPKKMHELYNLWKNKFSDMFYPETFHYDKYKWRRDALCSDSSDEEAIKWDSHLPFDFKKLSFKLKKGFYSSDWVMFHRGAREQKYFVLGNLF